MLPGTQDTQPEIDQALDLVTGLAARPSLRGLP